jgi:hypothetical protein
VSEGNGTGLRRNTVVVVSGTLPSGEVIAQEVSLTHDPGAPSSALIGSAFNVIRQVGGLSLDSFDKESMYFYPLSKFDRVTFQVKKVQLAVTGLIQ